MQDKHSLGLLNGGSLGHLTGAIVKSKQETSVQLPASSMADVLETIHRLGHTGNLQVNFHKGRPMDLKFTQTRDAKPNDV